MTPLPNQPLVSGETREPEIRDKLGCPRCSIGTPIFGDYCIVCVHVSDGIAGLIKEIQAKREEAESSATAYALKLGRSETRVERLEKALRGMVDWWNNDGGSLDDCLSKAQDALERKG